MGRGWLGALLVLAAVLGLSYGARRWYVAADWETCAVCRRPVHAHTRTVALVEGRKTFYCCPSCAISQHHQGGKELIVTELTDYASGARLAPRDAWLVRGSDFNPCLPKHGLVDADRRVATVEFDRCAPGMLAFARREDAARFVAGHGGQVTPFGALAAAFVH